MKLKTSQLFFNRLSDVNGQKYPDGVKTTFTPGTEVEIIASKARRDGGISVLAQHPEGWWAWCDRDSLEG